MSDQAQRRSRRWLMRRVDRLQRRRVKAVAPPAPPFLAAVSLVDGYCERLGPVGNDNHSAPEVRRLRPPLALVRV